MFRLFIAFAAIAAYAGEDPLNQAVEALKAENYATAAPLLEQALEADPDHLEARFNLAFAYTQLGEDAKAIDSYKKVLDLKADVPQALTNVGILLIRQERAGEAIPYLEKLTELRPDDFQAVFALGRARAGLGELEAASAALERAAEIDPSSGHAAYEYGRVLIALERFEDAEREYLRAAELDPQFASLKLELADLLNKSGRQDRAISLYLERLETHPDDVAVREQAGFLLLNSGQADKAVEHLLSAATASPTPANLAALAQAYGMSDQPEEALKTWKSAVELDPLDAGLHLRYATSLLKGMHYADAGKSYFKTVEIDPENAEAWTGLAFALYQVENYPATLRALAEAAKRSDEKPGSVYLRAITQDKLQLYEEAQASYMEFLALKAPMEDEVWKSEQRLIVIEKVLAKR